MEVNANLTQKIKRFVAFILCFKTVISLYQLKRTDIYVAQFSVNTVFFI